ncbi:MAG: hypothetical protein WCC58_04675 [Burkholderiales bacterium]
MNMNKCLIMGFLLAGLPLVSAAQTAEPLNKLDDKLQMEKMFKGKITEADIDVLANAFKSALAGKPAALPEDFKQRILGIAESLRAEITPLMGSLIDEVTKTAKDAVRGEKI